MGYFGFLERIMLASGIWPMILSVPIGLPDDEWTPHWERSSAARRANGINETLQAVEKTIQESSRFMSGDIVGAARI
jgi:hypothetical protein